MSTDVENYDPKYVLQEVNRQPRDVVTNQRWNELWTLLITQGDHTAEWLDTTINRLLEVESDLEDVIEGEINLTTVIEYEDQTDDENSEYYGIKYILQAEEGKPYLEVVET